ncbi:NUDIX domain-containing protein [Micromonospora sp. STR1s_5]|nr:NUDIX domain-containing protein [Micromonospora sp. STR1s_5]
MRIVESSEDRVLLQLRSDYGEWGLPGGVPDKEERPNETVAREILEHTGIGVRNPIPSGFAAHPAHEVWTSPNGDRCRCFTSLYHADQFDGTLFHGNNESLNVGWLG